MIDLGSSRSRSAASAGVLRAASMVARAVVGLIFAKLLGAAEVGVFFLAIAVAGLGALLARGGLDRLALAEVGRHPEAVRQVAGRLGRLVLGSSMALATIGTAAALFGPVPDQVNRGALAFAMAAILPLNLAQLSANVLRGSRQVASSLVVGDLLAPVIRIVVFIILPMEMNATRATLAFLIAWACSATVGLGMLARSKTDDGHRVSWTMDRPWQQGRPLLAFSLTNQLRETFITSFGWAIGSPIEVGSLGAASRIEQMSLLPTTSTRFVTAPDLVSRGDELNERAAGVATRSARKSMAVQVPFLIAAWMLAPYLLSLLGDDFQSATGFVRILLIGSAINALTGSTTQLLLMSDHRRELARSSLAGLMVLIAVSVALAPPLGVTAIAIGLAAGYSTIGIVEWWLVRYRLGARVDVLAPGPKQPVAR